MVFVRQPVRTVFIFDTIGFVSWWIQLKSFLKIIMNDCEFVLRDYDLHSKSTFMFISTLFNLQAGETSSADVATTLTVPVN